MRLSKLLERICTGLSCSFAGAATGIVIGGATVFGIAMSNNRHTEVADETLSWIMIGSAALFGLAGLIYSQILDYEDGHYGSERSSSSDNPHIKPSSLEDNSVGSSTGGVGDDSSQGGYSSVGR